MQSFGIHKIIIFPINISGELMFLLVSLEADSGFSGKTCKFAIKSNDLLRKIYLNVLRTDIYV